MYIQSFILKQYLKRILLLIGSLAMSFSIFAQKKVNPTYKLSHVTSDAQKIAAYQEITNYYVELNPDSAENYAMLGFQFAAQKNMQLDKGKMLALLGAIDRNQGRTDIAEKRLTEALEIYRQHNYRIGIADMNIHLGSIEAGKGNFDKAVKYLITALRLNDSLRNKDGMFTAYLNLGKIYMQQSDSANTMRYLFLAADLSKKMPRSDNIISLYNTLGVCYIIINNDTAKGLHTFLTSLELSRQPQFAKSHVECLMYLGNFYIDKGAPDKAMPYLEDALNIAREKKIAEEESNVLLMMAVAIKGKQPDKALAYLNQALTLSQTVHNKTFEITIYEEIANLYKDRGKYKEALATTDRKQNLKDSIFNISRAKEIASINAAYQFDHFNDKISGLEALNKERKFERDAIIAVAVVMVVVLVGLLFFYRRTTVLNRKLTQHQRDLEEANGMKNKLFSIIGHDLRGPINNIPAMLDIYHHETTTDEERQFLLASLKEHTLATTETLDKLLYWGQSLIKGNVLSQIKLQPKVLINQSIDFKKMAAAQKRITIIDNTPAGISVFADPTHFDFIMRNLISNAIKYTKPNGWIEINADILRKPGFIVFSVKDNGVGIDRSLLPDIFNPLNSTYGTANEKGTGIGLMLCKQFVVQNGGSIWVESELGKGATFYFSKKSVA